MNETPAAHVGPNTQAQRVREELHRITAQPQWERDDYWKFYLVGNPKHRPLPPTNNYIERPPRDPPRYIR